MSPREGCRVKKTLDKPHTRQYTNTVADIIRCLQSYTIKRIQLGTLLKSTARHLLS